MSIDAAPVQSAPAPNPPVEAFDLERFDWAGPDRLEVAGTFAGIGDAPAGAPVLVVHGADRVHRLPAMPDADQPVEGRPWRAAFAWQEAPEPFETAELELDGHAIALPRPGAKAPEAPLDSARQLGLEAELLTAREQIRDLQVEAERNREELDHARRALAAERDRRSGDAERFRAGIAQVRASAEEALAAAGAERDRAVAERDELRDRVAAQLQALRSALDGSS